MTPTFGPTLSTILSITVVHNNFEDASSTDCSNSDAGLSSSSSSSSPTSSLTSSLSTTPTITNLNNTTIPSISQHSALSRRSSESIVDTNIAQYFKKQSIRRYTLPSIINSLSNSTGQDHNNNSTPVPQSPDSNPRFWEIGNRREGVDSSVHVAMGHVQFGL